MKMSQKSEKFCDEYVNVVTSLFYIFNDVWYFEKVSTLFCWHAQ